MYIFGWRALTTPDVERLQAAKSLSWKELLSHCGGKKPAVDESGWKAIACRHLESADEALNKNRLQVAWTEVKAADRAFLLDEQDHGAYVSKARTLLNEIARFEGWPGSSIKDLLSGKDGSLLAPADLSRQAVVEAAFLRDDYFDTEYYKVRLRRRHLQQISGTMIAILCILLVCTYFKFLPLFTDMSQLLGVILMGTLGATLSVAQALLSADLTARITSQKVAAFLVWTRPVVGAVSAVILYTLLLANTYLKIFSDGLATRPEGIMVLALVAGFSERFIIGALGKIADAQKSK